MMRDWREDDLEKLEKFRGVSFRLKSYATYRPGWDRDHCEMCLAKFTDQKLKTSDGLNEGYASTDSYVHGEDVAWFCADCFEFLKTRLDLIDETDRH